MALESSGPPKRLENCWAELPVLPGCCGVAGGGEADPDRAGFQQPGFVVLAQVAETGVQIE